MKVGFIGLGRMGAAMAANLLKAGHEVTVYNRSPDKARALSALGARVAASVADTCRGEAVITMLANDEAVEAVVFDACRRAGQYRARWVAHQHEHHQRRVVGAARRRAR